MNSLTLKLCDVQVAPVERERFEIAADGLCATADLHGLRPAEVRDAFEDLFLTEKANLLLRDVILENLCADIDSRLPIPLGLCSDPSAFSLAALPYSKGRPLPALPVISDFEMMLLHHGGRFADVFDPDVNSLGMPRELFDYWRILVSLLNKSRTVFCRERSGSVPQTDFAERCRREDEAIIGLDLPGLPALPSEIVGNHLPDEMKTVWSCLSGLTSGPGGRLVRCRTDDIPSGPRIAPDPEGKTAKDRLTAIEEETKAVIAACCLDDPSVLGDADFITSDDIRRMRSLLRKIDTAGALLSASADGLLTDRVRRLSDEARLIRRACACRA